jgi:hypothetical protein
MACPGDPLGVLAQHLLHRLDARSVKQKRSNEPFTSCQASSRPGMSAIGEAVVEFVMALLSFVDQHPEPNGSRRATPPSYFNIDRDIPQFDRNQNCVTITRDGHANVGCVHLTSPMV